MVDRLQTRFLAPTDLPMLIIPGRFYGAQIAFRAAKASSKQA